MTVLLLPIRESTYYYYLYYLQDGVFSAPGPGKALQAGNKGLGGGGGKTTHPYPRGRGGEGERGK